MGWIQTYTGKQFWPLDPNPEDFSIEDIAHSLSLQCRFNGHCRSFYSVAEHSVRVSLITPLEHAMWGLLHDASEAYMADIPRPVKQQLPEYQEMEYELLRRFAEVYHLSWPIPPDIRVADDILLATEKRDLMRPPPASWGLEVEPLDETIVPMSPADAKGWFLQRYEELKSQGR